MARRGIEMSLAQADAHQQHHGFLPISKNENPAGFKLQHPELKCYAAPALERAGKRKGKSVRRTRVRFIGYRVRPLDPDNFAGGCKDLLDGLRHAQLISGDEPWRIIFETEQIKVASFAQEGTVIEIDSP